MNKISLELLSPAKDLESGFSAINCGADAVYIGAPKFGARAAAGNSIEDIRKLVEYAHKFLAKIYVTVNTIIFDNELAEVQRLITELYEIGVDAVIFQDMSLLEMNIPPIQLFASTQTHNYELERIKFLDDLGIKRIILARELSIDQIKEIRANTSAELEFFIHGALCVCMSGQCYLSESMFERSANRGECAQPCRLQYSLVDKNGNVIIKDKHLLSLRDLNLSAYLYELIEAGITSFKIEGRLKDIGYIKNITAYYRQKLDSIIENNDLLKRSSSGHSQIPFDPDPDKTFNRGYTSYFINGTDENLSSIDTPKSKGKYLGKVSRLTKNSFTIDTKEKIVNGDGLCFFDVRNELTGMYVNKVESNTIYSNNLSGLKKGTEIYRNLDISFNNELKKECTRKIKINITVDEIESGLRITAIDEDGVSSKLEKTIDKIKAENGRKAIDVIRTQFSKSGDTVFEVNEVLLNLSFPLFIQIKVINEIRREIIKQHEQQRLLEYNSRRTDYRQKNPKYPKREIDFKFNVVNNLSKKFYMDHGADEIEDGFELQDRHSGKILMTCKYCIKKEIDKCTITSKELLNEPLYLVQNSKKYKLAFNCQECKMELISPH